MARYTPEQGVRITFDSAYPESKLTEITPFHLSALRFSVL
jgi:hypothetical protein